MDKPFKHSKEMAKSPVPCHQPIEFCGIDSAPRGTIFRLLTESYNGWPDRESKLDVWRSTDRDFFDNPNTIGACVIFTLQADQIVGFVSWDPRQFPTAVIGNNCVLPTCRNRGIGKRQLVHALEALAAKGFHRATVTTGDSDFFAPARRMYTSCGFEQVSAEPGNTACPVAYFLNLTQMPRQDAE